MLLGLEEGLAGWLWNNLDPAAVKTDLLPKTDKCIFLFDEESRSTKYGIGTYVNQLTDALQDTEWQVVRVRMFSNLNEVYNLHKEKNIIYFDLAGFKSRGGNELIKKYNFEVDPIPNKPKAVQAKSVADIVYEAMKALLENIKEFILDLAEKLLENGIDTNKINDFKEKDYPSIEDDFEDMGF